MKEIFILVSLILFSCSSRKVNTQISEVKKDSLIEKTIDTKIKINKNTDSNTNINTFVYSDEIILTPIDTSKSILYNNVEYKNVVLTIKKSKVNSLYTNTKKVSENAQKQQKETIKIQTKEVKNNKSKIIDKKANYFIYLWFILGILIIYIIWRSKRLFL